MRADKRKSLKKHLASGALVSTLFSLLVLGPMAVGDVSWFWQNRDWTEALSFTVLVTSVILAWCVAGGLVGFLVFEARNK